ncbi:MAG: redoxin domain-containing protein, partial [Bacteroidota bacterium]|nr:redoxin domain-containing protein [Bacteroidota bacterium]
MHYKNDYRLSIKAFAIGMAGFFITTTASAQTKATNNQSGKATKATQMENTTGTTITLGGNAIHTIGKLPAVGTQVKDFTLTAVDLHDKTFSDYKGKYVIMNIFPSVNTGVCSKSVRKFNEEAAGLKNTTVLCIS